ncbi:hypothetical protein [Chitinophaga cymbidii]|uniref:hypothetical protein n=1 Tax=Chitinophaga cymbidii TaxID=1096750 RepID=UPI00164A119D|nr:hypothetical protein [Chitinophaga cymbidii]
MNAPMGEVVKKLLSNEKTARMLTAHVTYALAKGLTPVIKIGNERYALTRSTARSIK